MRTCQGLLLALAVPSLVLGQSLADAAREEQERRDARRRAGAATRVVTDEDLKNAEGRLANVPAAVDQAAEQESKRAESKPPRKPSAAAAGPKVATEPALQGREAEWRARARYARSRLAAAERRYSALLGQIRFGQPEMYDQNGQIVIYSQQQMKAMADAAEAQLAAAKKALDDLQDEARRAGALPGWLR